MFELISNGHQQTPHTDAVPLVISWAVHLAAIGALVSVPLLYANANLPALPSMAAFVAPSATPPPPPPPPAPAVARPAQVAAPNSSPSAAPIEAPSSITPDPAQTGAADGFAAGVAGGAPGGVEGGVLGGLSAAAPPPPPPPPPPAQEGPRGPVRMGGDIRPPAILKRVDAVYPELARRASVEGVVILEATVDQNGLVEDVRVLRSIPLLDGAARAAVRQWQYSPLVLNGRPERFILTVTLSFSLARS